MKWSGSGARPGWAHRILGRARVAATLVAALVAAACGSDPVSPGGAADVQIRLTMSGGIAGVEYTLLVDGRRGAVVGEQCRNGCVFQPGEVLLGVSAAQVQDWANRLRSAGIETLDGTDYGSECCDRFHAVLTYADAASEATVQGNTDLMPQAFQAVITEVSGLMGKSLPIVVVADPDPGRLTNDPLSVIELTLSGSTLQFVLEYGGGCEAHAIELLATGDWMESEPVQIPVVLTHDDRDDPCDALVRETLSFDLRPLEDAWDRSYPGGTPGARRLIMNLQVPGGAGPSLTHTF